MSNETNKIYAINKLDGIKIILDNGGGITLQLSHKAGESEYEYQHFYEYDQAEQLRDDVYAWIDGENPLDWDGNQIVEHGLLEPTYEQVRNGGYKEVYTVEELISANGSQNGDALLATFEIEA